MRYYTTELPHINIDEALKVSPVIDENQGHINLTIGSPYNSTVSLPITVTTPYYGGHRWWFECPMSYCGRRTPHLYIEDDVIACRRCLQLRYETQYYPKGTVHGALLALYQAEILAKTGKRLWYGGYPTRTGKRYMKLRFLDQLIKQN